MRSGARREVEQGHTDFVLKVEFKLERAASDEILMLTWRELH
jgi:hypothetical protein